LVEIKSAEFEQLAGGGKLQGKYLLFGSETYLKEQAVSLAVSSMIDAANMSLDLLSVDAQEAEAGEVLNFSLAPSFMSGNRAVVVREIGKARPGQRKKWITLAERSGIRAVIVFTTSEAKLTTAFLRDLAGRCVCVKFSSLTERQTRSWLKKRSKEKGISFSDDALERLLSMVGPDLRALDNELEKLALYFMGSSSVEETDVAVASHGTTAGYLEDLRNAVLERNLRQALAAVEQALHSGESVPYLLASIYYLWRDLVKLASSESARNEVVRSPEWSYLGRLGRKKLGALARYDRPHLWDGLLEFFAFDLAVKRGFLKPQAALMNLIPGLILGSQRGHPRMQGGAG